ncbi:MAG: AAA family ATPase, partial [Pseudomonadota bacterium]
MVVRGVGGGLGDALPEGAGRSVEEMLRDWAERYGRAVEAGDEPAIRGVGAEMFAWLEQGGALEAWMAGPERALEVCVAPTEAGALADALLAAPWEVLADGNRVLAEDAKLFSVARRCAEGGAPQPPQHRDLSLMFMAAAPAGQHDLDYEREEAAILTATAPKGDRPPLAHLQVEESGALEFLAERLTFDGPFEALHISCHGNIAKDAAGRPVPVLLLETDEGGSDEVAPARLTEIRGLPPLVFLSACRTAEQGPAGGAPAREGYRERGLAEAPGAWSGLEEPGGRDDGRRKEARLARDVVPELADPYVRQLAGQVANVIGWDGSVYDVDATAFAEAFYGAIVRGDTVPVAAARARKAVLALRDEDPRLGRHWHLARVYLGPGGGGAICDPLKPKRQAVPPAETVFLDDEARLVPVARPAEFVGRRRAIQRVIRAYRTGHKGVVVHGMGNLGKSSLAARVAGRLRRHKTVAVFGPATERTMFQALARAGRQIAADMAFSEGEALREELTTMERVIGKDRSRFGDMVQTLFDRVFDTHPVLLVLDDFEQSLVTPTEGGGRVVPRPEARAVAALLRALAEADTAARLLVTTRFDFAVPDGGGGDLAAPLARVPLAPMEPRERRKQVQAKARAAGQEAAAAGDLTARALAAAGGNPGLQDVLTRPLLTGNAAEADAAIAAIERFRAEGAAPPPGDDLGDFFQRMAFETYTSALSDAERRVLGAATLFEEGLPVPRTALAAAAAAGAVSAPEPAIDRLLALGLLDDFGPMSGWPGIAATPLLEERRGAEHPPLGIRERARVGL